MPYFMPNILKGRQIFELNSWVLGFNIIYSVRSVNYGIHHCGHEKVSFNSNSKGSQ